jgi:biopolymer transport protein ExbD
MGGGGGGGESGEPEFQIAPMIDVLLTLLIFFMSITSAEVLKVDKDIKLPVAPDAKKKDKNTALFEAALNVGWQPATQKSRLTFEDKPYDENTYPDLIALLQQRISAMEDRKSKGLIAPTTKYRVIIRGDMRLPAIEIQKVMTLIAQAGIDEISFSALNHQ